MQRAIKINNVSHSFKDKEVLNSIDLEIKEGEIFGLLGPSGAGKTTLINIVTGQIIATEGTSEIFGVSSNKLSGEQYKKIGVMMDHFGLYERMSCYDNLKVNKIAARWPAKAVAQFSTSSKKGSDKIVPK